MWESTSTSGPSLPLNESQQLPKNFKSPETVFFCIKNGQKSPSQKPNFDKKSWFLIWFFNLWGWNCIPLSSPKTMSKPFLNNSKTYLRKSRKRLLWPQNCQNTGVNFGKKGHFWVNFCDSSYKITLLGLIKKLKLFPQ